MNQEAPQKAAFVSIITVSLNAASTISDTLQSVMRQRASFPIEHICIDGGSLDGTRRIIDEFAQLNPQLTRVYEPDRGLFDAMNKGLRLAQGKYVLFLNADDFLIGDHSMQDALADISMGEAVDPDMVMCDVLMGQLDTFGLWRHRRVPRWLPKAPRLGAHPPHQGNLVKRSLLLKAGGFDSQQRLAADTTQFYKLVYEFRPVLHVAGVPVTFMRSGGASNATFGGYRRGNIETYRFLRQYQPSVLCAIAVAIKLAQKVFEYRIGTLRRNNLIAA